MGKTVKAPSASVEVAVEVEGGLSGWEAGRAREAKPK